MATAEKKNKNNDILIIFNQQYTKEGGKWSSHSMYFEQKVAGSKYKMLFLFFLNPFNWVN